MASHAIHDIDLSDNPQNILPEDAQHPKKASEKQLTNGMYWIVFMSNPLIFST